MNADKELAGLDAVAAQDHEHDDEPEAPRPPTFAVGDHVHIDGVEFKITYVRDDGRMTLEVVR